MGRYRPHRLVHMPVAAQAQQIDLIATTQRTWWQMSHAKHHRRRMRRIRRRVAMALAS